MQYRFSGILYMELIWIKSIPGVLEVIPNHAGYAAVKGKHIPSPHKHTRYKCFGPRIRLLSLDPGYDSGCVLGIFLPFGSELPPEKRILVLNRNSDHHDHDHRDQHKHQPVDRPQSCA